MADEFRFSIPFPDIDFTLIGCDPAEVGSPRFAERVSAFFADQFQKLGGKARILVNDEDRVIEVRWTKGDRWKSPKDQVLGMLQSGKLAEAVPLLWTLHRESPEDTDHLFNLGVAYSELGEIPKAVDLLQRLVDTAPDHVHGLVALGVAQIRSGNLLFGEEVLRKALTLDSDNRWALRNLGACLMKQGKFDEAVPHLEHCLRLEPGDVQSVIGLAQAFEHLDRGEEADELYERAIRQGGPQPLMDLAKERRTHIAHRTLKERSSVRPDVVMYITGALERFESMSTKEIQSLGFEIALLGQSGLDINNPEKKYSIRSLPGEFTGLHLVAIMYAAFQQFAPEEDVGIDFSQEYAQAVAIHRGNRD